MRFFAWVVATSRLQPEESAKVKGGKAATPTSELASRMLRRPAATGGHATCGTIAEEKAKSVVRFGSHDGH
jgi:hypothetical protein